MTVLLAAAVATVAIDALTKQVVILRLVEGRLYGVGTGAGWGVRRVHNERGSFVGLPVWCTALLWVALVGFVTLAARMSPGGVAPSIGLGATLGGATGNFVDRIVRGSVVDFAAAGRWPVFNLADAAMTIGLLLAAVSLL